MEVPGHTAGHIAFYGGHALFCDDTLFSCGCGRIFGGNAQQMHASLQKLASVPDETKIYCAHEYTLANIEFAKTVDPDNSVLFELEEDCRRKRANNLPTLSSPVWLSKKQSTLFCAVIRGPLLTAPASMKAGN